MAISTIIKQKCPKCGQTAKEKSRINLGKTILVSFECGHVVNESFLQSESSRYDSIKSIDGRSLMPYQIDGVKFAENANANCLIADEQGLGKTVQACAVIKLHFGDLSPAAIVTKTAIKLQWFYETMRWTGEKKIQVINSSKEFAVPGFDIYIITYDLLKDEKIFEHVKLKTLILDECQSIKNHLSARAKAVQKIKLNHNIEHVIGLSGTPIKNHAGEYFTILNLLRPTMFPEHKQYLNRFCETHESNFYQTKVGGLKNPEYFHQLTSDFIIRRTKDEVLKDLPVLSRNFHHAELRKDLGSAYDRAISELEEIMYAENQADAMSSMLAVYTRLRQITGISKVTECVDFVTEHLLSTNRKIVIFLHHEIVLDLLKADLNKWLADGGFNPVLTMTSDLSSDRRNNVIEQFKNDSASRIMIASTLSAGEGLNLQFCSDAIMLERQWNPANEEQAEARFHRFGQLNPVTITYMIASGTIDEYFTELVERKRAIVASTLDNKEIAWDQTSLMKELAGILIAKGKKSWKL